MILNKELNKKLSPTYTKGTQGRTTSSSKIRSIIRKKLEGKTYNQIGKELKLDHKTVAKHWKLFLKNKGKNYA